MVMNSDRTDIDALKNKTFSVNFRKQKRPIDLAKCWDQLGLKAIISRQVYSSMNQNTLCWIDFLGINVWFQKITILPPTEDL